MYDFNAIIKNFDITGALVSCERYGEGHINETYLAVIDNGGKKVDFILQKINNKIFKNVDGLMKNIESVTEFSRKKIVERGGNPDRESLSLIYTKDGKSYYFDEKSEGYFRIYKFITDAVAYQVVEKPEHFYQSAVAFGNFANLLSKFDASGLFEVIPNFHNTKKRFKDFTASLNADKLNRAKDIKEEIKFVVDRENYCGKIVDLLESGKMPIKVTHNDTKLNNVMVDVESGKPVAVIDLDTIMPGSICYDFGDSIRFGCNPASEDEKDLSKVNFDVNLFEQYVKGYLYALGDSITAIEKENLVTGAILMTYECGMRFLTDYLDGDVYFHTKRDGQNLDRARTQFKLVSDMERLYDKLQNIVNEY
jgi:hypothetical protein